MIIKALQKIRTLAKCFRMETKDVAEAKNNSKFHFGCFGEFIHWNRIFKVKYSQFSSWLHNHQKPFHLVHAYFLSCLIKSRSMILYQLQARKGDTVNVPYQNSRTAVYPHTKAHSNPSFSLFNIFNLFIFVYFTGKSVSDYKFTGM